MSRGKYIVIEGNDGTGKSTQVDMLSKFLNDQGIESISMHEPAGTPIADAIRTVIKNGDLERDAWTNLLLFTAARHENWRVCSNALEQGTWVVSARNYISTEVYQGYGEGLPVEDIHALTRKFTDELYMNPDYTFVLTLDDESREQRIGARGQLETKDTFESRDREFQTRLNNGYIELAAKYGFDTIDANDSINTIQLKIRSLISLDEAQNIS